MTSLDSLNKFQVDMLLFGPLGNRQGLICQLYRLIDGAKLPDIIQNREIVDVEPL